MTLIADKYTVTTFCETKKDARSRDVPGVGSTSGSGRVGPRILKITAGYGLGQKF